MALITLSDFQNLPAEPILRWLELRDLLEKRIDDLSFDPSPGLSDSDLLEYCTVLAEAANALNLDALQKPGHGSIRADFGSFRAEATALATRLSIDPNFLNYSCPVLLERTTKKNIIIEIEKLRSLIIESDLPDRQRDRLERKLAELHTLVVSPKFDVVKALLILTAIGSITVNSTAFLADAPAAIGTITSLIGLDKDAAEEDAKLLQKPSTLPRLPDLREAKPYDDEIPF